MPSTTSLRDELGGIDIYLLDQILRGRIDASDVVLDAGCGMGRNLKYLMTAGCRILAADADADAIASVRTLAAECGAAARVDARIEARIGVAIGHVDDLARARAGAGEAGAARHPYRRDARCDFHHQLVRSGLVEPYRAALRGQHLLRCRHHLGQHRAEVERCRQLAGDAEDRLEVMRGEVAPGSPGLHAGAM